MFIFFLHWLLDHLDLDRPEASQRDIFQDVESYVEAAVQGYNSTVFVYGQTGAGTSCAKILTSQLFLTLSIPLSIRKNIYHAGPEPRSRNYSSRGE